MSFKRGIGGGGSSASVPPTAPIVIGKPISFRQSIIVEPNAQPPQRITQPVEQPPSRVRGLLVDGTGRPLRGLSQATIEAHKAHAETESELCTNCGKMRTPAQMRTVINNAYNSNNPLRICDVPGDPTSCAQLAYKDPHKVEAKQLDGWRPSIPSVRFDRETAAPYDARERGVTLKDLTTRDTYHSEREVDAKYRPDALVGEGRWSGGGRTGRQVTPETVAQSRERAGRRR